MTLEEYLVKFEKMQTWMMSDLRRSTIDAHANFLVAMGIFNYLEILGSFCVTDSRRGYATRRFNFVFDNLLPNTYQNIFNRLELLTDGAYDCLRCGMSHEYLVKTYNNHGQSVEIAFTIYGIENEGQYLQNIASEDCGSIYFKTKIVTI